MSRKKRKIVADPKFTAFERMLLLDELEAGRIKQEVFDALIEEEPVNGKTYETAFMLYSRIMSDRMPIHPAPPAQLESLDVDLDQTRIPHAEFDDDGVHSENEPLRFGNEAEGEVNEHGNSDEIGYFVEIEQGNGEDTRNSVDMLPYTADNFEVRRRRVFIGKLIPLGLLHTAGTVNASSPCGCGSSSVQAAGEKVDDLPVSFVRFSASVSGHCRCIRRSSLIHRDCCRRPQRLLLRPCLHAACLRWGACIG